MEQDYIDDEPVSGRQKGPPEGKPQIRQGRKRRQGRERRGTKEARRRERKEFLESQQDALQPFPEFIGRRTQDQEDELVASDGSSRETQAGQVQKKNIEGGLHE